MPSSSWNSSNPRSICLELSECTATVIPGWPSASGVVRSETEGRAVGIAPIRSCPESPPRMASSSASSPPTSARIRRAHSSTFSPSGVSPS